MAAGMDLHHIQPADLGVLEDFHTSGRIATSQLAELAEITSNNEVLGHPRPGEHHPLVLEQLRVGVDRAGAGAPEPAAHLFEAPHDLVAVAEV
jgi:hypothetical protein